MVGFQLDVAPSQEKHESTENGSLSTKTTPMDDQTLGNGILSSLSDTLSPSYKPIYKTNPTVPKTFTLPSSASSNDDKTVLRPMTAKNWNKFENRYSYPRFEVKSSNAFSRGIAESCEFASSFDVRDRVKSFETQSISKSLEEQVRQNSESVVSIGTSCDFSTEDLSMKSKVTEQNLTNEKKLKTDRSTFYENMVPHWKTSVFTQDQSEHDKETYSEENTDLLNNNPKSMNEEYETTLKSSLKYNVASEKDIMGSKNITEHTLIPNKKRYSLNIDKLDEDGYFEPGGSGKGFSLSKDELELIKRYRSRRKCSEDIYSDSDDWAESTRSLDRHKSRKSKTVRFKDLGEVLQTKEVLKTSLSEIPGPSKVEVTTIPAPSVQSNPTISCNVSIPLQLVTSGDPNRRHFFQNTHPYPIQSNNPFLYPFLTGANNPVNSSDSNPFRQYMYGEHNKDSYSHGYLPAPENSYSASYNPSSESSSFSEQSTNHAQACGSNGSEETKTFEDICRDYLSRTSSLRSSNSVATSSRVKEVTDSNSNNILPSSDNCQMKSTKLIQDEMRREGGLHYYSVPVIEKVAKEEKHDSDESDILPPPPINYATLPSPDSLPRKASWERAFECTTDL